MNLTLTQLNQPAPSAKNGAAAANDAAAAPAPAAAGAAPAADAAQPALGFAQWLGLNPLAVPLAEAPAATAEDAPLDTDAAAAAGEQAVADTPLLGAMATAMPLMPVAQAALAAVVAAMPGAPAPKESASAADTGTSQPAAPAGQGREGRVELTLPAALPVARASLDAAPGAAAKPAAAAAPAEALAVNADAAQEQVAPALDRGTANSFGVGASAPGAAQRTGDTVTLAGPPTAWRQTLQEALGERLQLQVGKNAEQAVIRLEPPMLGRVEIAIRHSAGSLEVHISATHGEVLRQLQTVSEGLRNDLAQRQFSDVSVNIAQAPRGAAGANNTPTFAGGDGRGRQQDERQQEQGPGEALAEANTGSAPFSLNGRGQGRM